MEISVYTDGSFIKHKNYAGYGIYFPPPSPFKSVGKKFTIQPLTNQRAELYAIYKTLKIIHTSRYNISKITIYSDSKYSINSLTVWAKVWANNGWHTSTGKPVKNLDIIQPTYNLINKMPPLTFIHVRSHTGKKDTHSVNNEIADMLSKQSLK